MENKTIGIVDWYDNEKGYGMLKNIHDHREYFIHQSKLGKQSKRSPEEGDIVMFVPNYDQKRNRELATNILFFNKTTNIEWVINKWIQEDYLLDSYLEKIIISYLNDYDKDEYSSFKVAYYQLTEIIWPFLEVEGISEKLFSIIRNAILSAFEQIKGFALLELTYSVMMGKLPSDIYFGLLDSYASPYICFIFGLNEPKYANDAIQKAIDNSRDACNLLDDLIKFAKYVNRDEVKES